MMVTQKARRDRSRYRALLFASMGDVYSSTSEKATNEVWCKREGKPLGKVGKRDERKQNNSRLRVHGATLGSSPARSLFSGNARTADGRGSIYVLIPPGDGPLGRKSAGGEADGGRRWKWEASNHRGEASVQNNWERELAASKAERHDQTFSSYLTSSTSRSRDGTPGPRGGGRKGPNLAQGKKKRRDQQPQTRRGGGGGGGGGHWWGGGQEEPEGPPSG
ncbi:hypothetical protein BDP55DRAFT_14821 [Colletotrichum godetiae]|uniref:Uncharacterized protein n=1 Tax=Colletotrichum godetiae TaxID=1209918 RepID=A0AAJ0AZN0_9PEZI|nr:uncharacterized protein BDP55DRAFT_14821 [Colletotrichum godetiae]KAK1701247.1 hypothetical protein BDP55DRAFT_14821 [Colletotrichum godetiae]